MSGQKIGVYFQEEYHGPHNTASLDAVEQRAHRDKKNRVVLEEANEIWGQWVSIATYDTWGQMLQAAKKRRQELDESHLPPSLPRESLPPKRSRQR